MKILIINDKLTGSNYEIFKWLRFFEIEVILFTEDFHQEYELVSITSKSYIISSKSSKINYNIDLDFKSIWQFRGQITLPISNAQIDDLEILKNFNNEICKKTQFINERFYKFNKLFGICNSYINKLNILENALSIGMKVPEYIITGNKNELLSFQDKYKKIITKSTSDGISFFKNNILYMSYTSIIEKSDLKDLSNYFYPSVFYKYIKKKYEIRVFYFDKKIYASAILSQNDHTTNIDYRRYNYHRPNRIVPFTLPIRIQNQITKLMNLCNFNTGSIDLIYSTSGAFYFLEINPEGLYGHVGFICNFYLEKIIAETLINNE